MKQQDTKLKQEKQKYLKHLEEYLEPGHAQICWAFKSWVFKESEVKETGSQVFKDLKIPCEPNEQWEKNNPYIKNLKLLSEKNFCRLLFSIYAKHKGKNLADAESGSDKWSPLLIVLASVVIPCFIISVAVVSFIPSLLLFTLLAAILSLVLFKNTKDLKKDVIQGNNTRTVDDCIDEGLFRERSDSIRNFLINKLPGKDLFVSVFAKVSGPIGEFFVSIKEDTITQKKETKPKGETEFIKNVILGSIGLIFAFKVAIEGFAAMTSFATSIGIVAGLVTSTGTLAALGILCVVSFAVCKAVHGLFLYDKKQTNEKIDEEQKVQREKYFDKYKDMSSKLVKQASESNEDLEIKDLKIEQPVKGTTLNLH